MINVITKPVVVLFSGGLDSLAALVWAREGYDPKNVLALYCDVGQRYADKEIKAVEEICKQLKQDYTIEKRLYLGDLELPPEQNALIPYRNTMFILLAAMHTPPEGGIVMIQNIVVGETSTWDRRPEFNEQVSSLLEVADPRRVTLKIPHENKTKSHIVEYLKDRVSEEIILRTVGCYSEGDGNCGRCNSCFRSFVALINGGIPFPERRFVESPLGWKEGIKGYVQRMHGGQYQQVRVDETFRALAMINVLHQYMGKTYVFDLDGVISDTGTEKFNRTMTGEDCQKVYKNALPKYDMVKKVNSLYDKGNIIIIHTARYEEDRALTEEWLRLWEVKYHRLVMGKPRADFYVDDKNMSVEEL